VPETTSVDSPPEQMPLIFSLKLNDKQQPILYLNDNPVDDAGLKKMLGDTKLNKDQQVSLSADRTIPYGEVMKYIDLLESLGLKKLALDTRHVEQR